MRAGWLTAWCRPVPGSRYRAFHRGLYYCASVASLEIKQRVSLTCPLSVADGLIAEESAAELTGLPIFAVSCTLLSVNHPQILVISG